MRLHVNVTVHNIAESVRFYSTLFGAQPALLKEDYAKWELADPHLHLSVSTHGSRSGVDHLGIQLDNLDQLRQITGRLTSTRLPVIEQDNTACCYARSDKTWVTDPAGLAWEVFHTSEQISTFGAVDRREAPSDNTAASSQACCARANAQEPKV
jgi:catechol 2,3-dioxygenase-like lactoylglutathione lyase family enzyme